MRPLAVLILIGLAIGLIGSCGGGSSDPEWYQDIKQEHPGVTLEEACAIEVAIARGDFSERVQDCEDAGVPVSRPVDQDDSFNEPPQVQVPSYGDSTLNQEHCYSGVDPNVNSNQDYIPPCD